MTSRIRGAVLAFVLVACLIVAGCASGKVKVATVAPRAAMAKYMTVAITVCNDVGAKCPQDVSSNLQGAAISQLLAKYPSAFQEVRPAPTGAEGEMLVDVHIVGYKKGSKLARAMMIGLGSSKISTAINFIDSATKEKLATGQLSLTWAMGGILGASKGIEDVVNDAGAKIANAIVEQKLGTPAKAK